MHTFFFNSNPKEFQVAPWKSLFRVQIKLAIDFHIINRFEMLANEVVHILKFITCSVNASIGFSLKIIIICKSFWTFLLWIQYPKIWLIPGHHGVLCWFALNSILLHSGLNPAWHFWLSTRFSCCLKMESVENILGYIREQFYKFSRGWKPR